MHIQAPGVIMTMKIDGTHKQKVEGISTTQFKYNLISNSILYVDTDGNLMKADLNDKTIRILINQNQLNALFGDSYFKL